MSSVTLSEMEFRAFQEFIRAQAGVTLPQGKQALVRSRLAKRLERHGLRSYSAYLQLLAQGTDPTEVQVAIDLLTTHETFFFREPKHFKWLSQLARQPRHNRDPFRVWSAACSTGEEAYSIAMVLYDVFGPLRWELVASDVSEVALARARSGHYSLYRSDGIPPAYLKRFCLRGVGSEAGTLLVDRALRNRVKFLQVNLDRPLPQVGTFDVVFLRNVLIYFDNATKRAVVRRLLACLRPGGHLLIGHSESLQGVVGELRMIEPGVYCRPDGRRGVA